MAVIVKTNKCAWEKAIKKASEKAISAAITQMYNDSLQYIPDDGEHNLRDKGQFIGTGIEQGIEWDTVYAAYQWYGVWPDGSHVVKEYTTPGTGKMWVEQARVNSDKTWQQVAQDALTEGL